MSCVQASCLSYMNWPAATPMVAETLHVLGRGDEAIPWVEGYKSRLQDHPESHHPISREDWWEVLGNIQRVGD